MHELLRVENLRKEFPVGNGLRLRAVDDVSLDVFEGESLAIVGESGCGKSTLARCMLRLLEPTAGHVFLKGKDILRTRDMREFRRTVQMVFQNPLSSLDSRQRVNDIIAEPLVINRVGTPKSRTARVAELMEQVGVDPSDMARHPHAFSGGQLQRIAIARALALKPALLVCDEAVSALDVSIQAQVLHLLADLREAEGLTYVFITHNLAIVPHIAQSVAVMYLGRFVEVGPVDRVFNRPQHPYTQALLNSVLSARPRTERIREIPQLSGEVPVATNIPPGCRFHTRCPRMRSLCREESPVLEASSTGQRVACFFPVQSTVP